ncbi:Gti1/Pac2 family domain containing protein [Rhypophila sp. PSN 637]
MSSFPPRGGPLREENGRATRGKDSRNAPARPDTAKDKLGPTLTGVFLDNTLDAFIVIQACLDGKIPVLHRRPTETENTELIVKNGCVVVYEERASTIKRWTDPKNWSPSRLFGNFLGYRETEPETEDLLPGEKKKARKAKKTGTRVSNNRVAKPGSPGDQVQRRLLGSLVGESYVFKHDGLMKKTLTVPIEDGKEKRFFHIVNYYDPEDADEGGSLRRPLSIPELWGKLDASFAKKEFRNSPIAELMTDDHPGRDVYLAQGYLTGFMLQVPATAYDQGDTPVYYAQYHQQQYTTPHHSQAQQMGAYPSSYASAYPSAHQQYGDFSAPYTPHPALQYGPAQMQLTYPPTVDQTQWSDPAVHYGGLGTLEAKEESPETDGF